MAISTIDQTGLNAPLTLTSPVLTTPNLGTPSAINLSNATSLPKAALPSGTVLQTVAFTNSTATSGTAGTEAVIFSVGTITPSSSSSKIMISSSTAIGLVGTVSNFAADLLLRRGTTTSGALIQAARFGQYQNSAAGTREIYLTVSLLGLDSPATTSPLSYCISILNVDGAPNWQINQNGGFSNFVLQEIAG